MSDTTLWYNRPAADWNEALPVGNGRLGAMVFGGTAAERLQFNEDTLWTGRPRDYLNPKAKANLPKVRQLLADGRQEEATDLAMRTMMSIPLGQEHYEPFGDLWLDQPGHEAARDYRRQLDIAEGIATVRYKVGATTFTREVFASVPDQVIVVRVWAEAAGAVNVTARMSSPHPKTATLAKGKDLLVMRGRLIAKGHPSQRSGNVLKFEAQVLATAEGGTVSVGADGVKVSGADSVTLRLAAATSFVNFRLVSAEPAERCAKVIAAVGGRPYGLLRSRHVADHRAMFDRVQLELPGSDEAMRTLPTDERIRRFGEGRDGQLVATYFQFGRHLLMACSRPGTQTANLQGIWNEHVIPPWGSKYTVNINIEMNYWPAEVCNLSECHEALFDMVEDVAVTGARTAKAHYGCRGWLLHHNTDLWRGTAPINHANHGIWMTGGGVAGEPPVGAVPVHGGQEVPGRAGVSADEGEIGRAHV